MQLVFGRLYLFTEDVLKVESNLNIVFGLNFKVLFKWYSAMKAEFIIIFFFWVYLKSMQKFHGGSVHMYSPSDLKGACTKQMSEGRSGRERQLIVR